MDIELERLIEERFELMRRERYANTDFGYWGYAIPDGWFPLIVQFAKALEELAPQGLVIYQIKEKMNRLVICCESEGSEELVNALDNLEVLIEQRSQQRCGRCGEALPGERHVCHPRCQSHEMLLAWAQDYLTSHARQAT